jgi:hypothetical protein
MYFTLLNSVYHDIVCSLRQWWLLYFSFLYKELRSVPKSFDFSSFGWAARNDIVIIIHSRALCSSVNGKVQYLNNSTYFETLEHGGT